MAISIPEVLIACSSFLATIEKDHVFALQGITSAADENALVPDCELEFDDVHINAAKHVLRSKEPFSLVPLAGLGSGVFHDDLPSWVPDWRKTGGSWSPLSSIDALPVFQAGGDTTSNIINEEQVIGIQGVVWDTIIAVGQVKPHITPSLLGKDFVQEEHNARIAVNEQFRAKEAQAITLQYSRNPYPNNQTLQEAFWRTLICDTSRENRPAEQQCGEDLQTYIDMFAFSEQPILLN